MNVGKPKGACARALTDSQWVLIDFDSWIAKVVVQNNLPRPETSWL